MKTRENEFPQYVDKLKGIPKWTRAYAQNRTLPVLIGLVINLCLFAGIAIPSYLGAKAFVLGNMILLWICTVVLAVALLSLVYFCVPKWNARLIERISRRLYGTEGDVLICLEEAKRPSTGRRRCGG